MPNPALIHKQSSHLNHYLAIADLYITLNQPEPYEVEPFISEEYRPDVSTVLDGTPVLIELQRSIISNKKMQEKVNNFVATHRKDSHKAKTLLVITDYRYDLQAPPGYAVVQKKLGVL